MKEQTSLFQQVGAISVFIGVDIGGTLIKLAYSYFPLADKQQVEQVPCQLFVQNQQQSESSIKRNDRYRVNMIKFSTYEQFQRFVLKHFIQKKYNNIKVAVTGGGAFKYKQLLKKLQRQNTTIDTNANQWQAIIEALNIFASKSQAKVHHLKSNQNKISLPFATINYQQQNTQNELFSYVHNIEMPFIVANVGSGVSFLKIYKENQEVKFERIGGTSLGGGYFGGLAQFVTGGQFNFDSLKENKTEEILLRALQTCTNNLLQIMTLYCKVHNSKSGLFLGSFCQINGVKQIISKRLSSKMQNDLSGYLGVFGLVNTLIQKLQKQQKQQKQQK